jgi:methionine biosynthesis protein MetW
LRPGPNAAADCCTRVLGEVNREIESMLSGLAAPGGERRMLDVGCWDGTSTQARGEAFGATQLAGIEVFEEAAGAAAERGIEVARVDLESERFPWEDESVDVVVCNQVLEHLKNIWLPMSEMHRVLKPGGHAILSVPNLGSLHNRLLLAFGRQPTSIRLLGPHVRGYTLSAFTALVEHGGGYEVVATRGAGFYPLRPPWSVPFSTVWRGASHTFVVLARKAADRPLLPQYLSEPSIGTQTFYAPEAGSGTA